MSLPKLDDGAGWHRFCLGSGALEGTFLSSEKDEGGAGEEEGSSNKSVEKLPTLTVLFQLDEVPFF